MRRRIDLALRLRWSRNLSFHLSCAVVVFPLALCSVILPCWLKTCCHGLAPLVETRYSIGCLYTYLLMSTFSVGLVVMYVLLRL